MLYRDKEREPVTLNAKSEIVELAERLYAKRYPFSCKCNLDDLFEEMVVVLSYSNQILNEDEINQATGHLKGSSNEIQDFSNQLI